MTSFLAQCMLDSHVFATVVNEIPSHFTVYCAEGNKFLGIHI